MERYGGFVVDPNFAPNVDRNVTMDGIRKCLAEVLAARAAELGLEEPRLQQHELRAQPVQRELPAQGRGSQRQAEFEFDEDEDNVGGIPADGGARNAFFY